MKLLPEYETIEKQRDELIIDHGTQLPTVDPATGEQQTAADAPWTVPPEHMADFLAAWKPVSEEEIEVDIQPVPLSYLDCCATNGGIEANELITLGDLVTE